MSWMTSRAVKWSLLMVQALTRNTWWRRTGNGAQTKVDDSTKLSSLVEELIEALDRNERSWRHSISPSNPIAMNRDAT
jgi:hypothetical protein